MRSSQSPTSLARGDSCGRTFFPGSKRMSIGSTGHSATGRVHPRRHFEVSATWLDDESRELLCECGDEGCIEADPGDARRLPRERRLTRPPPGQKLVSARAKGTGPAGLEPATPGFGGLWQPVSAGPNPHESVPEIRGDALRSHHVGTKSGTKPRSCLRTSVRDFSGLRVRALPASPRPPEFAEALSAASELQHVGLVRSPRALPSDS